jgi:predicted ATPase
MSDGTLRALGILVALFQGRDGAGASLVAIEEPELALHPAAAAALAAAFREASLSRQVIVTTHSPELLDQARLAEDLVLAAQAEGGVARIAPAELGDREALRARLSVGELLRRGELGPDEAAAAVRDDQMALFEPGPGGDG